MISLVSVCLSVSPHASARLPLNEFPRNLILETATKIEREKIQILLRSDKKSGSLHEDLSRFIVAGDI